MNRKFRSSGTVTSDEKPSKEEREKTPPQPPTPSTSLTNQRALHLKRHPFISHAKVRQTTLVHSRTEGAFTGHGESD